MDEGQAPRFAVFGGLRLWRAGEERDTGPPQQRALLAMLVIADGEPVGMPEIVDTLWTQDPSASAVNLVHRYVGALRRVLEPDLAPRATGRFLLPAGNGYRLASDGHSDLARFRSLVEQARAATGPDAVGIWSEALDLARGDVAAGADLLRERPTVLAVERERVEAAIEAADTALGHDAGAAIVPALQRLAAAEPYDEPLQARLILLLAATGRHARALTVFVEVRARLAAELGIDPSPVLQDAYRHVLDAGTTSPPAPPPTPPVNGTAQLPAGTPMFAGRRTEVATALDLLNGDPGSTGTGIIAIVGLAGVGKTTLAIRCGHLLADRFPDGQLYVNLRGFDPAGRIVTADDALRSFLEALGLNATAIPAGVDDRAARFRSLTAGRRMLIVLDNARDPVQVRPLLPGGVGCRVIVTSRNRMTGLAVHDGARILPIGLLSDVEARQVVSRRLGSERTEADPDATAQVIDLCAGLPLALAIVSARAAATGFGLATLADELARSTHNLDAFAGEEATIDVRAVFSWSFSTLSPGAATLIRQLAVNPGPDIPFEAVVSTAGRPARDVRAALAELVAGSLLAEISPGRYALHDLVRAYVNELVEPAEYRDAFGRLLDHYVHSTRAAFLRFGRPPTFELTPARAGVVVSTPALDTRAACLWYLRERAILTALVDTAADAGHDRAVVSIVLDWRPMNQTVDSPASTLPYSLKALTAVRRLAEPVLEADVERDVSIKYGATRQEAQAAEHMQRALDLFIAMDDSAGEANALRNLATNEASAHRIESAVEYARRSVEAARRSPQSAILAFSLGTHASYLADAGRHTDALVAAQEGLAIVRANGFAYLEAIAVANLAVARWRTGSAAVAVPLFEEALDLARAEGDRHLELEMLHQYADLQFELGNQPAAGAAWTRFLQQAETVEFDTRFLDDDLVATVRHKLAALGETPLGETPT